MKFKKNIKITDIVEHLDKIIEHDEDEKPVIRISSGIDELKSCTKEHFEYGEEKILIELKKYLDLIKDKEKEELLCLKSLNFNQKFN